MGIPRSFEEEKLVMGVIYTERGLLKKALSDLCTVYGPTELMSEEYSFSAFSQYYCTEMMSTNLNRVFVSFTNLVDPSKLVSIKLVTNEYEKAQSIGGQRQINLDPCLLGHGKFVMASTKKASYRIPLSDGIYAELALLYSRNQWNDFFWTYHDVRSDLVKKYLSAVRNQYLLQRKTDSLGYPH